MNLRTKSLNYVKAISAETISNAKSGHTGVALGASTILFALFKDHLEFDISDTDYLNRDRFILSAGHASALYYTLLSMFGFNVALKDLRDFRKLGSITPGHPEYGVTDGVECTTGPLGQGVACAVGMAIAENLLEEKFNAVGFPIINNHIYCLCGDGCLMEGVAQEALSLAGTLNLKNLIILYDSNDVTLDGNIKISNRENVAKKYSSMGFEVIKVSDGNDYHMCTTAIKRAKKSSKPTIIIFKTKIGIGTAKEGTSAVHGLVMTSDELAQFKQSLGVKESFFIPNDVREFCMASSRRGKLHHEEWNQNLAIYSSTHPELYKKFLSFFENSKISYEKLLKNLLKKQDLSGRELNNILLNDISKEIECLIGGCADVGSSTKAVLDNYAFFSAGNKRGRNIHFGVREHAMAAICNGIAEYDNFIPFESTFLSFANYEIPALRLRAMMKLPVLSFYTHDSVLVGEDGPTHQPIEQISMLRSIIGLNVYRPASATELVSAYERAITNFEPTAIILSRNTMKQVPELPLKTVSFGAYSIYQNSEQAQVVIFSTGYDVALAIEIAKELEKKHTVKVISVPSIEVFEKQSEVYKEKLTKGASVKVAIEASNDERWYKYIGSDGLMFGVFEYQHSGKGEDIYEKVGFNCKNISKKIELKLRSIK